MNLHEYQGKQLFAKFGLPVSKNKVITSAEDAINACRDIGALNGLLRLKFMLVEEARLEELNLLIGLKRL